MSGDSDGLKSTGAVAEEVHSLFIAHIEVIRGFIRALVRDTHMADDVLQETFLTVSRKAGSFELGTNFPKWACSIARLKIYEVRRGESGRHLFFSEEVIEALAASHRPAQLDLRLDLVDRCIEELPPSMRKMVDMRYMMGRKPGEIARLVGWTVESVYVALSRARAVLKKCIRTKLVNMEGGA